MLRDNGLAERLRSTDDKAALYALLTEPATASNAAA
jgi:hypothetical protein